MRDRPPLRQPADRPRGPGIDVRLRRLTPRHVHELSAFLGRLAVAGDARHFHPHPFTTAVIAELAGSERRDEYHVLTAGRDGPVVGYGMLRGWEEGHAVPSLGVAVDGQWRGLGLGRRLVVHLHAVAIARGAARVRLKVYRANATAVALYRSLGYVLQAHSADEWLGVFDLAAARRMAAA